jgi:hypothetical protein
MKNNYHGSLILNLVFKPILFGYRQIVAVNDVIVVFVSQNMADLIVPLDGSPLSSLAFKILFEFTIYDMYTEDQYLESFVFCLPMIGAIIDLLENHCNTEEPEEEVKIEIL